MSAAEVDAAITAMMAGNGEANAYLMAFAETDAAWGVALELLGAGGSSPTCQFYAANMLHAKVSRHWRSLAPPQRGELCAALFALYDRVACGGARLETAAQHRFCLLTAALCARCGANDAAGFAPLIRRVLDCASAAAAASSGADVTAALLLSLDMAAALPEAAGLADLTGDQREALQLMLAQAQTEIFGFLQYALLDAAPVHAASPCA
uniref:Importin N-terminal domain-containing protein n=1 Tax=Phaeomonas parva TaxID=124430 RepID=A0A7S1XNF3_9STRA|mmetsp:Transcript_19113/g.57932  ORF Transcript_19113/g.57932 Transcript_19113/m.57932 type:complete len:209 (+) Transcript_19113:68-694(+)